MDATSNDADMVCEPSGDRLLIVDDTRFAWSGPDMIADMNAAGWSIARRYVPGPGTDEPVVWYEGVGTSGRRFSPSRGAAGRAARRSAPR